jgi:hypothetical protein
MTAPIDRSESVQKWRRIALKSSDNDHHRIQKLLPRLRECPDGLRSSSSTPADMKSKRRKRQLVPRLSPTATFRGMSFVSPVVHFQFLRSPTIIRRRFAPRSSSKVILSPLFVFLRRLLRYPTAVSPIPARFSSLHSNSALGSLFWSGLHLHNATHYGQSAFLRLSNRLSLLASKVVCPFTW